MAATKKIAIPAAPGAAIDLLFKVREGRKAIEAKVADVKADEKLIEDEIFKKFKKAELEGARGKQAQASISASELPTIEDDIKFFAYVLKTKQLDLLQRRLSVEAVRERWAEKISIPGVGKFTKIRLHLTKVKK